MIICPNGPEVSKQEKVWDSGSITKKNTFFPSYSLNVLNLNSKTTIANDIIFQRKSSSMQKCEKLRHRQKKHTFSHLHTPRTHTTA